MDWRLNRVPYSKFPKKKKKKKKKKEKKKKKKTTKKKNNKEKEGVSRRTRACPVDQRESTCRETAGGHAS